jgi:hypothetical protein
MAQIGEKPGNPCLSGRIVKGWRRFGSPGDGGRFHYEETQ